MVVSRMNTDYFQTICDLFDGGTFCDLKIVATGDEKNNDGDRRLTSYPILCHSIVLCAALPELKKCLLPSQAILEDHRTLILVGYDRDSIQNAIHGIYAELVNCSGQSHKEPWLKSFGLPFDHQFPKDNDPEHNFTEPDYTEDTSIIADVVKPEFFDPVDELSIRTEYNGDVVVCNDENHFNIGVSELMDTNCENKYVTKTTVVNDAGSSSSISTKKTTKLRKVRLKSNTGRNRDEIRKICFGCLKTFPFSTCEDRKIFSKHTLIHCKCQCDILFKSKIDFEKHMKTVHKGHLYKCDFKDCNSKSTLLKEYIRHRQKHIHCSNEESNICPDCGREFISSYYMKAHYASRHKKMKCKICGIFTYGTDDNQKHHNAVHKPNLVCEVCGKNFKTKSTLRCHVINVHTPEDQRPYKCDLCPKGFLNSRYLLTHVERDHKGNRAFTCRATRCDRTFTLPEVRKRHEKRDHNLNINLKPGVTSKFEVRNSTLQMTKHLSVLHGMHSTSHINQSS